MTKEEYLYQELEFARSNRLDLKKSNAPIKDRMKADIILMEASKDFYDEYIKKNPKSV